MFSMLKTIGWDFLDAKLIKCLDARIGFSASSIARLVLLNSSLDSIPFFFMSVFLINKTFIEKMNVHRRNFFVEEV